MKTVKTLHAVWYSLTVIAAMVVSGSFETSTILAQAETLPKGRSIFSVFYTRSDTANASCWSCVT